MAFEVDTDVLVPVCACELNLCRNVLRMPVPVAVCQAERNVDKEEGERRENETDSGQEKGQRASFTYPCSTWLQKTIFCRLTWNGIKVI